MLCPVLHLVLLQTTLRTCAAIVTSQGPASGSRSMRSAYQARPQTIAPTTCLMQS